MTVSVVLRQLRVLLRSAAERILEDPANFAVLAAQRLPVPIVTGIGRALSVGSGDVLRGTSAWLQGDVESALRVAKTSQVRGAAAAALGELSLRLGAPQAAERLRLRAGARRSGEMLEARILWHAGEMSRAAEAAPKGSPLQRRLRSERDIFVPGWRPRLDSRGRPQTSTPAPSLDEGHRPLWSLVNSVPHTRSGYSVRSHALLRALAAAGGDPAAITRTGYPTTIGRPVRGDVEVVDGVPYIRDLPLRFGKTPGERVVDQARAVRAAALSRGATVLHTTTHFVNGLAVREAAESLGLPWVYEVRGSLEDTWAASLGRGPEARTSERFRLFRARETEIARAADRVIALGQTMAAELIDRGVDADRITVVPNAVGDDVLAAQWSTPPAEVRAEHGLPVEGVWVGTAASIVHYEGLDILIDAVSAAREGGDDIRLLIVGGGEELPALRQRAERLGSAAVFTGRVPQARAHDLVRCLDIAAVPRRAVEVSRLVTPLKPVELAGLGRPVILSDLPALAETLPPSARRLVPAEDVDALADALVSLASDEALRKSMGNAGRRFAESERTWSSSAERIIRLYASLDREEEPVR